MSFASSPSSLSALLARASQCLAQAPGGLPSPLTLFVSMSDGRSRARTVRASGASLGAVWRSAAQAAQALAQRHELKVRWLRVDWVTDQRELTFGALQALLSRTKRNYFRYGVSLDADLKRAFLEPELNALAMVYPGSDCAEAGVNQKNFSAHVQRRFGTQALPTFAEDEPVWIFAHEGAFFSDDAALAPLPGGQAPVAWVGGPGSCQLPWRDKRCLNAGRRAVDSLQPEQVWSVVDSSAHFLARQVLPTGQFIYGHFPCFGRQIAAYNVLRHASTIYSMLEGWELLRTDQLLDAIRRALRYLVATLIRRYPQPDGSVRAFNVEANGEVKLGANAVSLLALVKYDELTGDTQYRPLMEELAQGIASMQHPETGQFVHVLNGADLSVKDAFRIVYYDGEAAFGLMRLYGLTGDPRWLAVVEKAFAYFLQANHWQHHDHWLSYCVNELTLYRPEEKYFRFGVQNIAGHLDFIAQRETTYPTLLELSMAFKAMLTRIDQQHPDAAHVLQGLNVEQFHQAMHHRAHYLLNGFFWPELAMFFKNPATVVGSFFIRHHAFRVRIDDIEHYLSGYVAYWKLLQRDAQQA